MNVNAQTTNDSQTEKVTTIYGEIVGTEDVKSVKLKVKVDLGAYTNYLFIDGTGNYLTSNNERMKFESMVDAMNYMTAQGWQFVEAYVVHKEHHSIIRWIIKKDITGQNDALRGFKTKDLSKSKTKS